MIASMPSAMADPKKKYVGCRSAVSPFDSRVEERTMKYMLLTYLDEKAWLAMSPEEQKREMDKCAPHVEKMLAAKKILAGAPLHPTSTATTIRNRDGRRVLTDGPFAETREQLGGYTIIDAKDLDEAIAIASGFMADSDVATIEVRPILDYEGTPAVPA
jgi:hypothetical protein